MSENLVSQREAWAEAEARSFDKTADAIEQCVDAWTKNPTPENLIRGAEAAFSVRVWRQAARSLRGPQMVREEHEALSGLEQS